MDEKAEDEYRKYLVEAVQKAEDSYDKAILSLSGSAVGISILFINNIASELTMKCFLITAWICWAISLSAVVVSFFFSNMAHRKAIEQADKKNFNGGTGGLISLVISRLNIGSGFLFILGVCFFIFFASNNL